MVGALFMVGGCSGQPEMIPEDRSTINLISVTDGTHPWLSIPLQYDPTTVNLCPLRWSPITRTLAYLDGNRLCTWNPSNNVTLLGGTQWRGPWWSPDGSDLVVSSPTRTMVLSSDGLTVKKQFDGDYIVWWSDGKLCAANRQDAGQHGKQETQTYEMSDQITRLPAGLSLVSAAPDGRLLLAQTNYKGSSPSEGIFEMLGVDAHTGQILWVKPAPTQATRDFAPPDLVWNERFQVAAESVDTGGGFDLHGFVIKGEKTMELKFATSANYSWISGPLTWTGEEMFAPMTLARVIQVSPKETQLHFWSELALLDGQTNAIRTVASGLPFEVAAASQDYVAMLVIDQDGPKIVITPWVKDASGKIQGVTYVPTPPSEGAGARVASLVGSRPNASAHS